MKELRTGGATLQQIADRLTADGIETPRGGKWYPATVRRILNSNRLDDAAAEIAAAADAVADDARAASTDAVGVTATAAAFTATQLAAAPAAVGDADDAIEHVEDIADAKNAQVTAAGGVEIQVAGRDITVLFPAGFYARADARDAYRARVTAAQAAAAEAGDSIAHDGDWRGWSLDWAFPESYNLLPAPASELSETLPVRGRKIGGDIVQFGYKQIESLKSIFDQLNFPDPECAMVEVLGEPTDIIET